MIHEQGLHLSAAAPVNSPGPASACGAASQGAILIWLSTCYFCDGVLAFADRYRRWLLLTVLFFYLAAFNGQWRIQPDAALYLSIGRNVATGKGFTYLGEPNHLAYPGWPGLIALTFKMFGTQSLLPVHILNLLISLLTLAAVYRLFLIRSGRPTAIIVTVGTGLTKAFFCYAFELWSDMPFALGVMCAFAGYEGLSVNHARPVAERRSAGKLRVDMLLLVGGIVFAAIMRPTIWPLLAAMVLASIIRAFHRRNWKWGVPGLVAGIVAMLGVFSLLGWIRGGPSGVGTIYVEYLVNRITGHDSGVATHPIMQNVSDLLTVAASDVMFQTRLGPYVNSVLSIVVLALGFELFRYRILWGLWFVLLLLTILISQAALDRYFVPVLPLLVFAWWDQLARLNRKLPAQWTNLVFLGLLGFGCLMNVTKVCGIVVQQHQAPFLAKYNQGLYDGTPEFSKRLNHKVTADALVLTKAPYGRVIAYLSDREVTNVLNTPTGQLHTRPVFVIEPSSEALQKILKTAGLVEGPAIFSVNPSREHGPMATTMSLHSTHKLER